MKKILHKRVDKGIKDILTAFATAKFVSSFTVDEDDIADKIFAESSFIEV